MTLKTEYERFRCQTRPKTVDQNQKTDIYYQQTWCNIIQRKPEEK